MTKMVSARGQLSMPSAGYRWLKMNMNGSTAVRMSYKKRLETGRDRIRFGDGAGGVGGKPNRGRVVGKNAEIEAEKVGGDERHHEDLQVGDVDESRGVSAAMTM